jgi:hypothetical protein
MFKCTVARLCPLYAKQAICAHFTLHYKHTNWEHKIPGYTRSLLRIIVAHYLYTAASEAGVLHPYYVKPSKLQSVNISQRVLTLFGALLPPG